MKKAHLERISPWAYLRRHETKTLNTLPEPSLSVSLSSPNLGSPRIRTNEQRDREAGEPSRPRAPSHLRDSAMATVMQKIKDIEDEVTIPPQVHLVFAAPGCRLPC
jgi:hypothetical protein